VDSAPRVGTRVRISLPIAAGRLPTGAEIPVTGGTR